MDWLKYLAQSQQAEGGSVTSSLNSMLKKLKYLRDKGVKITPEMITRTMATEPGLSDLAKDPGHLRTMNSWLHGKLLSERDKANLTGKSPVEITNIAQEKVNPRISDVGGNVWYPTESGQDINRVYDTIISDMEKNLPKHYPDIKYSDENIETAARRIVKNNSKDMYTGKVGGRYTPGTMGFTDKKLVTDLIGLNPRAYVDNYSNERDIANSLIYSVPYHENLHLLDRHKNVNRKSIKEKIAKYLQSKHKDPHISMSRNSAGHFDGYDGLMENIDSAKLLNNEAIGPDELLDPNFVDLAGRKLPDVTEYLDDVPTNNNPDLPPQIKQPETPVTAKPESAPPIEFPVERTRGPIDPDYVRTILDKARRRGGGGVAGLAAGTAFLGAPDDASAASIEDYLSQSEKGTLPTDVERNLNTSKDPFKKDMLDGLMEALDTYYQNIEKPVGDVARKGMKSLGFKDEYSEVDPRDAAMYGSLGMYYYNPEKETFEANPVQDVGMVTETLTGEVIPALLGGGALKKGAQAIDKWNTGRQAKKGENWIKAAEDFKGGMIDKGEAIEVPRLNQYYDEVSKGRDEVLKPFRERYTSGAPIDNKAAEEATKAARMKALAKLGKETGGEFKSLEDIVRDIRDDEITKVIP